MIIYSNEEKFLLTKLYNKTNEELILIKDLFDIDLVIKKEFSRKIVQMQFFKDSNWVLSKLENLSTNGILDCIKNRIKNLIKNSDNILRRILVNYASLVDKDFDFISYFLEKGYDITEVPKKIDDMCNEYVDLIEQEKNSLQRR